ncbi:hypothetical protein KAFR_0D03500 [Kazachstania africana CBS 2517]|uniref:Extracellular membrane protein CFEM domain-containing protein n=1 Tax=Kazachstania africana (strain ATCC 22294 / BCRC 22015 / CBS 2517 / CECT 1963 / NBRC 1671 / NRRL Y-8276) TaxID=1071382 RepID=H2AUE8_KAZAF|nr:hypothetical protein KAFR_0D03500 [Kazachstania africana CBS 2517]CCF57998.1 hypothetical protein KAFR_0D03500 [Kazachstania africana CBS 2517]
MLTSFILSLGLFCSFVHSSGVENYELCPTLDSKELPKFLSSCDSGLKECIERNFEEEPFSCSLCVIVNNQTLQDENNCYCAQCAVEVLVATCFKEHCNSVEEFDILNSVSKEFVSDSRPLFSIEEPSKTENLTYRKDKNDVLYRNLLSFERSSLIDHILNSFQPETKDETQSFNVLQARDYVPDQALYYTTTEYITTYIPKERTTTKWKPIVVESVQVIDKCSGKKKTTTIWDVETITDTEVETQIHTQIHNQTKTQISTATKTKTATETETETEIETETETEIKRKTATAYETETATATETETETETERYFHHVTKYEDITTTTDYNIVTKTDYDTITKRRIKYRPIYKTVTETDYTATTRIKYKHGYVTETETELEQTTLTLKMGHTVTKTQSIEHTTTDTTTKYKPKKKLVTVTVTKPSTQTQTATVTATTTKIKKKWRPVGIVTVTVTVTVTTKVVGNMQLPLPKFPMMSIIRMGALNGSDDTSIPYVVTAIPTSKETEDQTVPTSTVLPLTIQTSPPTSAIVGSNRTTSNSTVPRVTAAVGKNARASPTIEDAEVSSGSSQMNSHKMLSTVLVISFCTLAVLGISYNPNSSNSMNLFKYYSKDNEDEQDDSFSDQEIEITDEEFHSLSVHVPKEGLTLSQMEELLCVD